MTISLVNVLIAIVLVGWATYAHVVRGMVLSVREKEYIEAACALGIPPRQLVTRHILPNVISPVVVLASLDMGGFFSTDFSKHTIPWSSIKKLLSRLSWWLCSWRPASWRLALR